MSAEPQAGNTLGAAGRTHSGVVGDVPDAVRRRYLTDEKGGLGLGFYVDATVQQAAFRDHGRRLSLDRADPNAIRDAVEIAKHRGWVIVEAQGSAAFRREAWLAGRQLGLDVRGYRPTERDIQALERLKARRIQVDIQRERESEPGAREDRRARARDLRQATRAHRIIEQRGGAAMRVVEAVVRARVREPQDQRAIMDRARQRIADWLERGARFEQTADRPRSPDRQRVR